VAAETDGAKIKFVLDEFEGDRDKLTVVAFVGAALGNGELTSVEVEEEEE